MTIAHAVGDLGPIDYESPSSLYGDISPSSSSNDIPTPRPLDSGWNSPGAYDGTFTAGLTGASQVKDTAVVDSCDGQPNRKWRRLDNRGNNPACHQEPAGADTQPEPDTKTKDQLYPITHNHELCLPDIYGWLGALVICDRGREDLRHLDFATGGWIIEDVLPCTSDIPPLGPDRFLPFSFQREQGDERWNKSD